MDTAEAASDAASPARHSASHDPTLCRNKICFVTSAPAAQGGTMDLSTLESAYEHFVATLRKGGFRAPSKAGPRISWPATWLVTTSSSHRQPKGSSQVSNLPTTIEPQWTTLSFGPFLTRSVGSQAFARPSKHPRGVRRELGLLSTTTRRATCCLLPS